ncbi:class I SAM-dependent methyltransferase [Brevibacillus fortis]|uniref:class I SAM-dependent methyltransferase n=1 Tax=Brevibacillus fortis TaxID=2126352 RepID=UPI002E217A03|nr:class I SAM-dependent methyltransferase [Brevibacillus fortis]
MADWFALLKEAEGLLRVNDEQALDYYLQIVENQEELRAYSCWRIGEIYNRLGDPMSSFQYHRTAFELDPQLTKYYLKEDHPAYGYSYSEPKEIHVTNCPLCGETGSPYACVNATTMLDFIPGFHPVRLWMCCDSCHHLFACNYPENLSELLSNSQFDFNLDPRTARFPGICQTLKQIQYLAPGDRLLEVGVGAGEFAAVAKEMLFDVNGLDIRLPYANAVSNMLNIPVHTCDFQDFETSENFDIIIMGDVIEHILDPIQALRKAHSLLNEKGVLWISTPNFESAYSMVRKDADPMWRVVEHLNYFSFISLSKWLNRLGFEVVDYQVSSSYNGSMEVIAIKKPDEAA